MTDDQVEAVADAIDSALRSNHAMMYEECEAAARAAIAAMDKDGVDLAMSQVEQLFLDRIKVIGEGEYTMFGVPAELIVELDRLLAERDIDAMLDAVHPETYVELILTNPGEWEASVWMPGLDWSYEEPIATGTGPTRTSAIADACRKAREGWGDE